MQILAGLILLAILIVFHELGHFLFAKMLGVRVLVFSLGFGPKLLSFKYGETEYRLSAIPLGGYIRMFGESLEDQPSEADKKISFMHQAIWRKSLIAFAGPLFNFILPIVLFFGLLVGDEQVFLPKVGTLLPGSVAEKAGILPDDTIVAVDKKPITSFSEMADVIAEHPGKKVALTIDRPLSNGSKKTLIIPLIPEAKPSFNPLEDNKMVGRIGVMPAIEKTMVVLNENSELRAAGMKDFDEIVAIDDKPIHSMRGLNAALSHMWPGSIIKIKRVQENLGATELSIRVPSMPLKTLATVDPLIKNLTEEAPSSAIEPSIVATNQWLIEEKHQTDKSWGLAGAKGSITKIIQGSLAEKLGLKFHDRIIAINGEKLLSAHHLQQSVIEHSKETQTLGVLTDSGEAITILFKTPPHFEENLKLDADLGSIVGVNLPQVFEPGEAVVRKVGILEASKRALSQTWGIITMTTKSLFLLVKGAVPASQVGGPLQLFDMAQQAAHKGLAYYLFVMCLLSVNLGLLNLLPIPALDGGHLLLFGIEAIQRKPLTLKTRAIATQIGVALLLSIMALAIFNDISRLFR